MIPLKAVDKFRKSTGWVIEGLLGCGANGCVYGSVENNVVKITDLESEFRIAQLFKKTDPKTRHPAVPRIAAVRKAKIDGREIYAIAREDIQDIPEHEDELFTDIANTMQYIIETFYGAKSAPEMYNQLEKRSSKVSTKERKILEYLTDFTYWCANRGFVVIDLHPGNLGYRKSTGELVVRDFSAIVDLSY